MLSRVPQLVQLPVRRVLHVHDSRAGHAEDVPEQTPRCQRQVSLGLPLVRFRHRHFCPRSGKFCCILLVMSSYVMFDIFSDKTTPGRESIALSTGDFKT